MFVLLFFLLLHDLSQCLKHDYLIFLSGAGEDHQEGEMTPVVNVGEGSDYSLGRDLQPNPLDCLVKKKTTIRRRGLQYFMRCSSSHSFDKCEFRKIELTTNLALRWEHNDKSDWIIPASSLVTGEDCNAIQYLSCQDPGRGLIPGDRGYEWGWRENYLSL